MSDSVLDSDFGSTFLAGLDEIGIGGVGPPSKKEENQSSQKNSNKLSTKESSNKSKEKNVKVSAASNKTNESASNKNKDSKKISVDPPKKRPPRAPRINLADLSSLLPPTPIPAISPIPSNNHQTTKQENPFPRNEYQPKQMQSSYQQPPQIVQIENRITSYLHASLRQFESEFIQSLQNLLTEKDIVSPLASALISDLQTEIRRLIEFQNDRQQSNFDYASQIFDSYAPFFRDLCFDAERAKGTNYTKTTKGIQEARAEARSVAINFKSRVSETLDEFISLINDINIARMAENNKLKQFRKRKANVHEELLDLEARKIELKGKEKSLRNQAKKLESEQEDATSNGEIDIDEFRRALRTAVESIKNDNVYQRADLIRDMQRTCYQADSILEDVDAMRQMAIYQIQNLSDGIYAAQSVTYTYNTMRPQLPNESMTREEDSSGSDLSFESSSLGKSPSNELKKKFHDMAKKRRSQLQSATEFMDSMKRIEKKRNRKRVTDISLLSSA